MNRHRWQELNSVSIYPATHRHNADIKWHVLKKVCKLRELLSQPLRHNGRPSGLVSHHVPRVTKFSVSSQTCYQQHMLPCRKQKLKTICFFSRNMTWKKRGLKKEGWEQKYRRERKAERQGRIGSRRELTKRKHV